MNLRDAIFETEAEMRQKIDAKGKIKAKIIKMIFLRCKNLKLN